MCGIVSAFVHGAADKAAVSLHSAHCSRDKEAAEGDVFLCRRQRCYRPRRRGVERTLGEERRGGAGGGDGPGVCLCFPDCEMRKDQTTVCIFPHYHLTDFITNE